jgi:PKD repeat protein
MRTSALALSFLLALLSTSSGCGDDGGSTVTDAGIDAGIDAGSTVNQDARANLAPTASLAASPRAGAAPLSVALDASGSEDADGEIVAFAWDLGDGQSGTGAALQHTFSLPGCYRVVLTVTDDDGATGQAEVTIVVTQGSPFGQPAVSFAALPLPLAVLPRSLSTNEGTATVRGTVGSPGYDSVLVEVSRGDSVVHESTQSLCSQATPDSFDLAVPVEAVLENHTLRVYLVSGDERRRVATVDDVVAGEVFLIQGQSNAVASQQEGDANVNQGPFLRSFGTHSQTPDVTTADVAWHQAEGNRATGPGAIGQWGLRMGRLLVERHQIPIAILNGAKGGEPITYFQRHDADPTDLATNYGRLLHRVRAAGLQSGVRAILYYQGEADKTDPQAHHDGWVALHEAWLEDFPSVERTYVTQIRRGTLIREVQRRFADEIPAVAVMSTNGLDGHDGVHYVYAEGYEELGGWYAGLLGRDLFGAADLPDVEAPNVKRVYFSKANGTEVTIEVRDPGATMAWDPGAEADFIVEGQNVTVTSGSAQGVKVILTLSGSGLGATGLTYEGHAGAGPWVTNASGIGLLSFCAVPIEADPD